MPRPATRARRIKLSISRPAVVCSISRPAICRPPFSFVLFRLFFFCWSLPTDGADVGAATGSARQHPPLQTAPTIGGRVNQLSAFSRAREGSGHPDLASRASRRCRAQRHARGELNSRYRGRRWCARYRGRRSVDLLFRLFYFVCSFSVGRCRLMVPTSGQLRGQPDNTPRSKRHRR